MINTQKSTAFLYIDKWKQIKNILLIISSKEIEYLGVNLTKRVQCLCDKEYKITDV